MNVAIGPLPGETDVDRDARRQPLIDMKRRRRRSVEGCNSQHRSSVETRA
jgi:hypothetical protein